MKILISVLMVMAVMDSAVIAQDDDSYLSALHNSHDVDTLQGSFFCCLIFMCFSGVLIVVFWDIK